jgi:hypothetical protein
MLTLIVTHALLVWAQPGPGLPASELVLLMEIGVGERDIAAYADHLGGFETVDAETFARVEELGASAALLGRLPRARPDFGTISEIASTSEVHDDPRLGLSFVYPAGWTVHRVVDDDGTAILRISPRFGVEPRVFVSPSLFVVVVEESSLVREAASPIRERLGGCLVRALRKAGMRPSAGIRGTIPLLGGERETVAIEAVVDGPAAGVLELAFEVDGQGRAVGVGFTASAADRQQARLAFGRLAGSLVLR